MFSLCSSEPEHLPLGTLFSRSPSGSEMPISSPEKTHIKLAMLFKWVCSTFHIRFPNHVDTLTWARHQLRSPKTLFFQTLLTPVSKRQILSTIGIITYFRYQVTFVSIEFLPVVSPTEEELLDPRIFSDRVRACLFLRFFSNRVRACLCICFFVFSPIGWVHQHLCICLFASLSASNSLPDGRI